MTTAVGLAQSGQAYSEVSGFYNERVIDGFLPRWLRMYRQLLESLDEARHRYRQDVQ